MGKVGRFIERGGSGKWKEKKALRELSRKFQNLPTAFVNAFALRRKTQG
jgi:hypothetical protein